MSLYDIAKFALGALIFLLGVFMFFFPKLCTKKQEREIEYAVKGVKKNGIIMMIIGVVFEILLFVAPIVAGTM